MRARAKVKQLNINAREITYHLGITPRTLRVWIEKGKWPIPAGQIDRVAFWPREPIEQYLKTGQWVGDITFANPPPKTR